LLRQWPRDVPPVAVACQSPHLGQAGQRRLEDAVVEGHAHHHAALVAGVAGAFHRPERLSELILKGAADGFNVELGDPGQAGASTQIARRTRIWEFGSSLHCSIIGTCLTTSQLRNILVKLKVDGADAASDHELHAMGVVLAGRRFTVSGLSSSLPASIFERSST
jgi:hypothetical protein